MSYGLYFPIFVFFLFSLVPVCSVFNVGFRGVLDAFAEDSSGDGDGNDGGGDDDSDGSRLNIEVGEKRRLMLSSSSVLVMNTHVMSCVLP